MRTEGLHYQRPEISYDHGPNPLLSVWTWELRRLACSRLSWALTGAALLFFCGMIWFKHAWVIPLCTDSSQVARVTVFGTSPLGLRYEFVAVLLLVYALMVPFVVTEAVARDYKLRMHEVLMTTSVPNRAYVWGRFLAALCTSLGLALLLLVAEVVMAGWLHHTYPIYPAAAPNEILRLWAIVILPAAILLTGVGVALGALWPRHSGVIMLGMLITWVLLGVLVDILGQQLGFGQWLIYWNPSSAGVVRDRAVRLPPGGPGSANGVPAEQLARVVLGLQAQRAGPHPVGPAPLRAGRGRRGVGRRRGCRVPAFPAGNELKKGEYGIAHRPFEQAVRHGLGPA